MYEVAKQIHFCYGHRLLGHKGKCAHLHGHNGVAEILCRRPRLDANRMVIDFDRISESVKAWVMETLDHRMILNAKDPLVPFLKKSGELFFSLKGDPTAEAIAELLFNRAKRSGLPVHGVRVWETPFSCASYYGA